MSASNSSDLLNFIGEPSPDDQQQTTTVQTTAEKTTKPDLSIKPEVICFHCGGNESNIWRKFKDEHDCFQLFCNECCVEMNRTLHPYYQRTLTRNRSYVSAEELSFDKPETEVNESDSADAGVPSTGSDAQTATTMTTAMTTAMATVRKSTRSKRNIKSNGQTLKGHPSKGKGRRHIFKQFPIKKNASISQPMTSQAITFEGITYRVGDIVSMVDEEDGQTYFGQLRGFLQDEYCEKSAAITWLIPISDQAFQNQVFIPSQFVLGPEEEIPRKLNCMEFVCHAPSDYYKISASPYPILECGVNHKAGFIWSTLGPTLVRR